MYCQYCGYDTDCPTPPALSRGDEAYHEQEGHVYIVDEAIDGSAFDIIPIVNGEWNPHSPALNVNPCELAEV